MRTFPTSIGPEHPVHTMSRATAAGHGSLHADSRTSPGGAEPLLGLPTRAGRRPGRIASSQVEPDDDGVVVRGAEGTRVVVRLGDLGRAESLVVGEAHRFLVVDRRDLVGVDLPHRRAGYAR